MPYFDESFKECLDLLVYPDSSIIRSAASCATDLCCSAFKLTKSHPELLGNGNGMVKHDFHQCLTNHIFSVMTGLTMMLDATVPKLIEVIKEEEEREVVISVLEYLNKLIATVGMPVLQAATSPSVIFNLVRDVMKKKVAFLIIFDQHYSCTIFTCLILQIKCQREVDEDDEDEAEYDTLLIENAGELIPTLAEVAPSNDFVAFYNAMIPELMKKLVSSILLLLTILSCIAFYINIYFLAEIFLNSC